MSHYDIKPISLDRIRTYPLASRRSKVSVRDFARPLARGASLRQFLDSLPHILASEDLRAVAAAVVRARMRHKAILWGFGGHVIKVGLGPVINDLIGRGFISGIALNGAAMVHDFEIALIGNTSEDVEAGLGGGKFGMAEETGLLLNEIAVASARSQAHATSVHAIGLGEAAGKLLTSGRVRVKHPEASILVAAYHARVPVTVHLAIGADIPHMHRSVDGGALGVASHLDFRLFCALVKHMHPGGVYINWGSAVMLPEIFLKAVSVVRNLGTPLAPITTANFDFIQHYRPLQNVVQRPTTGKGSRGFAITGHHEILMPLLAAVITNAARGSRRSR